MQGHERVGSPRNGLDTMITQPGTRPQFLHCNDVVITIGGGGSHFEMVDELRRRRRRFRAAAPARPCAAPSSN